MYKVAIKRRWGWQLKNKCHLEVPHGRPASAYVIIIPSVGTYVKPCTSWRIFLIRMLRSTLRVLSASEETRNTDTCWIGLFARTYKAIPTKRYWEHFIRRKWKPFPSFSHTLTNSGAHSYATVCFTSQWNWGEICSAFTIRYVIFLTWSCTFSCLKYDCSVSRKAFISWRNMNRASCRKARNQLRLHLKFEFINREKGNYQANLEQGVRNTWRNHRLKVAQCH